jgi:hypothetical protein
MSVIQMTTSLVVNASREGLLPMSRSNI